MLAVHLATVCLLAVAGWLPRLVRRKVAMLCTFAIGFWRVPGLSFTSHDSARFNWHSCTVAGLKVPAMIVYDVAMTQSNFVSTTLLALSLALHLLFCFSQGKPLWWKEINTHTHIELVSKHKRSYLHLLEISKPTMFTFNKHFDVLIFMQKNVCLTSQSF